VPVSISLASSGPPTKEPISTGSRCRMVPFAINANEPLKGRTASAQAC